MLVRTGARAVLRCCTAADGKLVGMETGSGMLAGLLAMLSGTDCAVFVRAAVRTGSRAVLH